MQAKGSGTAGRFVPIEDDKPTVDVPYLDEARATDGWQGQDTSLSYDRLKSELTNVLARLGGMVSTFQRGAYEIGGLKRAGVQVSYSIEGPNGVMVRGRLDVAALPVKGPKRQHGWAETLRKREDAALRMALYNVVQALRSQWVLKQLNPGYIPLMPWLLGKGDATLSELYAEAGYTRALMPPKAASFVEGAFRET
jgi:hypothetical protein